MKGNLMILVCFLAGVFVGLGDFAPEWLLGHDLPIIILSLLIVQVGISLGSNNDLRGLFHSLNPRMSLLPVFTIGGTLLFSAIGVFLLHGRDLNDCLTIGSGFGYYSLSSVLIADIKSATLGPQGAAELATIALLANVIREMIALFGTPVLARWGGRLVPLSVAGINSMDVCLPMIVRSSYKGEELIPIAILHGIALEVSVPFLINVFC